MYIGKFGHVESFGSRQIPQKHRRCLLSCLVVVSRVLRGWYRKTINKTYNYWEGGVPTDMEVADQ